MGEQIGIALAIMGGLGVLFAAILATADRLLRVEEDPRIDDVEAMLPGSNCGACGVPGCRALAEQIVAGEAAPGLCTVSSPEGLEQIASYLGVDVGAGVKRVARLRCAGGEGSVKDLAPYEGVESCRGAVLVDGGARSCSWGCMGLGDCERACTFDAIHMNEQGLPQVDTDLCTACGDCVDVCPLDLFVIEPITNQLFVQCASPLTGEAARSRCVVACDGCGRCAADAPPGVIEMVNGLPQIHWDLEQKPGVESTFRCPTGAITWLEKDQFQEPSEDDLKVGGRHA